ncbi:MAG: dienelactone hydrolase [Verrucomicrobiales bacterium]|jgi:dienelactone hydrolase
MKTSSRRDALGLAGAGATGCFLNPLANAQDEPEFDQLNRFPRMVHNFYHEHVLRAERRGLAAKAKLETKADAEAYVKSVQKRIRSSFNPFPKEKCALNPQITSVLERDGYRIENVIFESRPRFFVTANLYVPTNRKGKLPGVVGTCGHSHNGKAETAYQSFSQGLAKMGYVVLIFDPIGQGERSQYLDEHGEDTVNVGTRQHNLAGNQQLLVGDSLHSWRAWDGIRALDYLLTREEVDPNHLGVTGNSGGGTMTTWLAGVEPRWTMAAPSCFVSTWRRNYENELPQDSEQCPWRSMAMALDHDDYLIAMAPKPVIILPKERDYFDVRGSEEVLGRMKRIYGLLGAEENVQLAAGPTTHGFSQENRESMYRFFNRATGISDAETEPELTMEKDEDLYAAPEGQVANLKPSSRTVFQFTSAKAGRLAESRPKLNGEKLREAVKLALRLPEWNPDEAPDFRIMRMLSGSGSRGYPAKRYTNYYVDTEPGMLGIVTMLWNGDASWVSRPPQPNETKAAVLYVSDKSADAELRDEPLIREVIEATPENVEFFACDLRGAGESVPGTTTADPYSFYGPDYFYSAYSNMLNRPYLGGKTFDLLRIVDWLASTGRTEVHLVASGVGTIPATFAALLSKRITQVTLKGSLTSYQEIAQTEHYEWPMSVFPPGVLRSFDLPEIYAELKSKKLKRINPA